MLEQNSTHYGSLLRSQIKSLRSQGNLRGAIEVAIQLCQRNELPEDFIQLSRLYMQLDDLPSAYAYVVLSLDQWPDYGHNYIAEAYCFLLLKKFTAAYHSLDKAMMCDLTQAQEAAIHRIRGQIYSGVGMSGKAIECFLDSLSIDDSDIDTSLMLSIEYGTLREMGMAQSVLGDLLLHKDLGHRKPEVWAQYCLTLINQNKFDEAKESGTQLAVHYPNSQFSAWPAIAFAECKGYLSDAMTLCLEYKEKYPNDSTINLAIERIGIKLIPIQGVQSLKGILDAD